MKKILIKGFGSIGQKHFYALKSIKCHIDVLTKRNLKITGSRNVFNNIKNCDRLYDLIIICSNTSDHLPDFNSLKSLGKKFLIEKPLSTISNINFNKSDKILKNTFVAYNLRQLPITIFLKEYLQKKKIIMISNRFWDDCRKWYSSRNLDKMYITNKDLGGGALLTNYHELDYIKFIANSEFSEIKTDFINNKISNFRIDEFVNVFGCLKKDKINFFSSLNIFSSIRIRDGFCLLENEYLNWDIDKGYVQSSHHGIIFKEETDYTKTYEDQINKILFSDFKFGSSFISNINDINLLKE